jgi:PEP-CTERM motif
MHRVLCSLAALVLCAGFTGRASAGNLIVNGGFETGDFTGWTLGGNTAGTFVGPPFPTTPGHAFSGEHAAVLGAVGTDGTLSQTFATVPGTLYELTLWGANGVGPPNQVTITLNGTTAFAATDDPVHDYVLHVFDFTATSTTYTLEFDYVHNTAGGAFVIDDVSVSAIPEPSTLTLLALGAGVLAARHWLKRR